jgi:hypothetical protein
MWLGVHHFAGTFAWFEAGAVDDNVEAYTPSTNSWARVTSLNIPRSGLAAAEGSDGRIYAIGGRHLSE